MATRVRVRINKREFEAALEKELYPQIVSEFQEAKLRDIRAASRRNYRNRTGRLFATIRRIPNGVAFGSEGAFYWIYIDDGTRGTGRFARRALLDPVRNEQVIRSINQRLRNRRFRVR